MVCQKCHDSLESLKRSLMKAVAEIPLGMMCAVTAQLLEYLKACIEQRVAILSDSIIN
jgi:hypothetical protein